MLGKAASISCFNAATQFGWSFTAGIQVILALRQIGLGAAGERVQVEGLS